MSDYANMSRHEAALEDGHYPMSDAQRAVEHECQHKVYAAVKAMREALEFTARWSDVAHIDPRVFEDFVGDEIPTKEIWDDRVDPY